MKKPTAEIRTLQVMLRQCFLAIEQATSLVNDMELRAAAIENPIDEAWAKTWGETLSKSAAARALGVSRPYLYELINSGAISTTPDGRVIVRDAARWANGLRAGGNYESDHQLSV